MENMDFNYSKLSTILSELCEMLWGEDSVSKDLIALISDGDFDTIDCKQFLRYADKCNKLGVKPRFSEWFASIAPEKTGAPSPRHLNAKKMEG